MPGWWIFLILFFNPTSIWHGLCIYMESYIRIIYEYISAFSCTFELTNKPNINGGIQIAICHRIPSRRRPSFWMCRTFLSAMHPNETFIQQQKNRVYQNSNRMKYETKTKRINSYRNWFDYGFFYFYFWFMYEFTGKYWTHSEWFLFWFSRLNECDSWVMHHRWRRKINKQTFNNRN